LGVVGRPLYLTPVFFANKPVERLLRPGLTAEMLNDDSLGRALDRLYEAGLTDIVSSTWPPRSVARGGREAGEAGSGAHHLHLFASQAPQPEASLSGCDDR